MKETNKTLYPLTPAQNMHHQWIKTYKTQQVSGVSIVVALQGVINIEVLKKAIKEEFKRYGCLRLRMTKPDKNGDVKQYLVQSDRRDIPLRDLSDMTMSEADQTMQQWAYNTFDGDDIPLCEFFLMLLPDNYKGFFVHMDHRLIDSVGMGIMVDDILQLYSHYKFGTPMPEDLPDFEKVLQDDLKKMENKKRFEKDKRFWDEQFDTLGEPLYSDFKGPSVLEASRKKHKNPKLRAADIELKDLFVTVKNYQLEPEPTKRLMSFCRNTSLSPCNLLLLGLRTYLSKVNNGQEDITIQNFISHRSTHDEWRSGGSRTIMYPCRTVITPDTDFISAAYEIQSTQNKIYMHSNYDLQLIMDEVKKRYNIPDNTSYVSCYLTYQPAPLAVENDSLKGVPFHFHWFANGAATKKMYLTVSHMPDGGMNYSFHYQPACLDEKDIELLYYYLMRVLFTGIENPEITVGELMEMV